MPFKESNANLRKTTQSGQVLIIILLVMIVGLTSGLFLLGRTTTDVSTSTKLEESSRAFNAAEAGVEEAIRAANTSTAEISIGTDLSYQVSVGDLVPDATTNIYPNAKEKITPLGDAYTIWLVPHDDTTGNLVEDQAQAYKRTFITVCFDGTGPAVDITAFYKDAGGKYRTSSIGYDSNAGRASSNNFQVAATNGACPTNGYAYMAVIDMRSAFGAGLNLTANGVIPLAFRIKPHYASAYVAVIPQVANSLPKQGNKIESTGKAGETSRKIEVSEQYTQPAPFLDHVLYSFGNADLTK